MVTIRDIARESGYSVSTVSRVIGGHPDVSAAAAERIREVIERRRFSVNRNARNLKRAESRTVLIVIKGEKNMLFASMLEHVQTGVTAAGYTTAVQYLDEDADEVAAAERLAAELKPSGAIFLGGNAEHFVAGAHLIGEQVPAVVLTNSTEIVGRPGISSVTTDDLEASRLAIDHLLDNGHRRIGVIGGNPDVSLTSQLRQAGALAAFSRRGVPFDVEAAYVPTRFSLEDGHAAGEALLRAVPGLTAIYAMSDIMAIGAMRALADHGLKVPRDVSLVGHDGISLTGYTVPKITTVGQPQAELARRGLDILARHMSGDREPEYGSVEVSLIEGESVRSADDREPEDASRAA